MLNQNVGIIIQARMGSKRLPGKVIKPLAGKPMIQWIIERLQGCKTTHNLVLATSLSKEEGPLLDLVNQMDVCLFKGSQLDVLDRYYQCAKEHNFDHIIRATGDNPFVDPEECDSLFNFYMGNGLSYANSFPEFGSGLPKGVGLEVFSFSALEKSWKEGNAAHHREHVDEYCIENPKIFKQQTLKCPPEKYAPDLSLTVDTNDEFENAEKIYKEYLRRHSDEFVRIEWIIKRFGK